MVETKNYSDNNITGIESELSKYLEVSNEIHESLLKLISTIHENK